jgi:hypothetical protein
MTVTGRNHFKAQLIDTTHLTGDCPILHQKMRNTYRLTYQNVFVDNQIIGPRNISDIFTVRHPGNIEYPNNHDLINCYGDHPISFSAPNECTGHECTFTITIESKCRPTDDDGQAFNLCERALNADRIADMGSDIAYPNQLDRSHGFYVRAYSCALDRENNDACTYINLSTDYGPDLVISYVTLNVQPTASIDSFYIVRGGLLPTPTLSLDWITPLSATYPGDGLVYNFIEVGNLQLELARALTFVIYVNSETDRVNNRLRIVSNDFQVYPVDSSGVVVTNAACDSLTWIQLQTLVQFTTKTDNEIRCEGQCAILPVCRDINGCDGFSITKSTLSLLCPASGYKVSLKYKHSLYVQSINGTDTNRHLLQTQEPEGDQFVIEQINEYAFIVFNNGTTLDAALRSEQSDVVYKYQGIIYGSSFGAFIAISLTFWARYKFNNFNVK